MAAQPSASSMAGLDIRELLLPSAYPHEVGEIRLRETHVSWVVLTGTIAYKLKKPIKLDFVDMRLLSQRRTLCQEELRLNRRLAADLYLDVVPITRDDRGAHVGGSGEALEYAVRMKQFEAAQELPALLARRDVSYTEMAALARRLADFHGGAPRCEDIGDLDHGERTSRSILGTLATLIAHRPAHIGAAELAHLIDWTHDTLHALSSSIAERQAGGFVRECHGDLHAGNIVRWDETLTPFDCLEFDRALRCIDVVSDIAFLFMDLVSHRREDLAHQFLSSYLEVTGDYAGIRGLPLYAVHRALVRAMVDALSAEQRPRDHFDERVLARLRTAAGFTRAARPTLYIMHGPSGSGKSWLSERLVPLIGAVRIRSDVERKRLPSASSPEERAGASSTLYSREMRERIYRILTDRAQGPLEAGMRVIVDATFLERTHRQAFLELARRLDARFVIVTCIADKAEMVRRIHSRAGRDPSDADVAVLEAQIDHLQPLDADEEHHAIRVDTTVPDVAAETAARLRAHEHLQNGGS
ncbi:MAG TPA: AAA family ATPase [Steroidobacteraceae bacterium]|nr:AAA family ATPase [Steroidobacteraceae bacterium]